MVKSTLFYLLILATNASLILLYPYSLRRLLGVAILYLLGSGLTLFLLFHPRNQWLVDNRAQVTGSSCVALTFDDGPDPVDTPRLLDILREKNVKATFFVVGRRAEQHPEIVRRAWEEGHLIANHTWSHPNLFCFLSSGHLRREIEDCSAMIQKICGVRTNYFRSPVGLRHPLLRTSLKQAGLEYISWSIRSYDTLIKNSTVLSRRILREVTCGGIILLHDHLGSGAETMLKALPGMIDELRARGFKLVLAGSREEAY